MIEIQGLSPIQKDMADRLWQLDSPEEVSNFIMGLPKSMRELAQVMHDMIIAAALDGYEGDLDLAKCVLDSVK